MYRINKSGPKTDPCGTLHVKSKSLLNLATFKTDTYATTKEYITKEFLGNKATNKIIH